MDTRALAELVGRMRAAQKGYFKTRTTESLEESKRLEREVDAAVKRVLEPPTALLFDVGGEG